MAAFLLTCFGAILSLTDIYRHDSDVAYPTLFAVIALIPAILLSPLARYQGKAPESMLKLLHSYSLIAGIIAGIIVGIKFLENVDIFFAFFVLPGFLAVLRAYFLDVKSSARSTFMRIGVIWLSIGFFPSFLYFISNFIPHVADDEHFWISGGIFTNWDFIK